METKFKLKEQNNEYILTKIINEKENFCVCPFSAPVLIPGQLAGQLQMIPRVCGSNCALFEVFDNNVVLNCSKKSFILEGKIKVSILKSGFEEF